MCQSQITITAKIGLLKHGIEKTYFLIVLQPTGHVMHHQFNIQQLFALPTPYLSENKQRLVPLTA